jgi:hypothetical protein
MAFSPLLVDLTEYIEANTSLVSDQDLFASILPDITDPCVALLEYKGAAGLETMGAGTLPAISVPKFQVISRATDYLTSHNNAWEVHRALIAISNTTINSVPYLRVQPLQTEPFFLERDDSRRVYFCCNYMPYREIT